MNVDDLVRAVLRRRAACVVVVVLAVFAGIYGAATSTTSYQSTAVAVVYPPGAGNTDAGLNPLANLNNNIGQTAVLLSSVMRSPDAVAAVEGAGASDQITVNSIAGDASSFAQLSPQIVVTTIGDSPESARAGAQALVDYGSRQLKALQTKIGVLPRTEVMMTTAVEPTLGTESSDTSLRAAGAYAIAVGVLGLLVVLAVGTYLDRRPAPKRTTGEPVTGTADEASPSTIDA
ncbi:hypothetical protein [Rhodococcus sp. NPDC058521]|uniref:hypothetical protein n=1 Tax=Rhodococcus sp. NPDC058521 TaxID=3346536 RepID=UPI00365A4131